MKFNLRLVFLAGIGYGSSICQTPEDWLEKKQGDIAPSEWKQAVEPSGGADDLILFDRVYVRHGSKLFPGYVFKKEGSGPDVRLTLMCRMPTDSGDLLNSQVFLKKVPDLAVQSAPDVASWFTKGSDVVFLQDFGLFEKGDLAKVVAVSPTMITVQDNAKTITFVHDRAIETIVKVKTNPDLENIELGAKLIFVRDYRSQARKGERGFVALGELKNTKKIFISRISKFTGTHDLISIPINEDLEATKNVEGEVLQEAVIAQIISTPQKPAAGLAG